MPKQESFPQEEKGDNKFYTGAGEGGAEILDPTGELAKGWEEAERKKEYGEPGSSNAVEIGLKRALAVQMNLPEKERDKNIIYKLETQIDILTRVKSQISEELGEKLTKQGYNEKEIQKKLDNISANDMYDYVDKFYIEFQQENSHKGFEKAGLPVHPILKENLKIAEALKGRLMDEYQTSQEKK